MLKNVNHCIHQAAISAAVLMWQGWVAPLVMQDVIQYDENKKKGT
jgi:hypothetical protein